MPVAELGEPRQSSLAIPKKVAQYLKYRPRLVINFDYHPEGEGLSAFSDSNYAGCVASMNSTSGGCIMAGRALLKSWSKQ